MAKDGMTARRSPFPTPGTESTQRAQQLGPGSAWGSAPEGPPRGDPPAHGPQTEEPEKATFPHPPGCTDLQVTLHKLLRPLVFRCITQKGQARACYGPSVRLLKVERQNSETLSARKAGAPLCSRDHPLHHREPPNSEKSFTFYFKRTHSKFSLNENFRQTEVDILLLPSSPFNGRDTKSLSSVKSQRAGNGGGMLRLSWHGLAASPGAQSPTLRETVPRMAQGPYDPRLGVK